MKCVAAADYDGLRVPNRMMWVAGLVKRLNRVSDLPQSGPNPGCEIVVRREHAGEGDKKHRIRLIAEQFPDLVSSVLQKFLTRVLRIT
jgi:hypothetical protein